MSELNASTLKALEEAYSAYANRTTEQNWRELHATYDALLRNHAPALLEAARERDRLRAELDAVLDAEGLL